MSSAISRGATVAVILSIPVSQVVHVTFAWAQPTVQAPAPGSGGSTSTSSTSSTTSTTTSGTTPTLTPFAPPGGRDSGPVGGGNVTSSSSRPLSGNERDGFDLGPKSGGGAGAARGTENGPIFSSGSRFGGDVPYQHLVRKGDTLWGICDSYFQNPYQWPRIWSYNAQIHNPHWIYPGDQVRLRSSSDRPSGNGSLTDRRRQVPNDTIFLRSEGFIDDKGDEDWGEVTGSPEDKMFLSTLDEIYLRVAPGHEVKLGQQLTIFRPVRGVSAGKVVQIQGTVRVDQWNPKERIARGQVTEALDVIERGARVGPVSRNFQVVPPVRNEAELAAHIITSVHPHNVYGQNQVVFIDRGADDGLKVGNRLFITRKGDAWRRTLATPGASNRISPESEKLPDMEKTPGSRDEAKYPDEIVGELRVVAVKAHTATCIVSQSKAEIEREDIAISRKGY